MKRRAFLAAAAAATLRAEPARALPSPRQLRRQALDLTAFLHFNMNTFTDREWGLGDEDPALFAPTALDADGIVRELADCGFKGVILTCKHHDGFCLWPTATTDHRIRQGDVVREFADAARRHHMPFGVYLSPWDRNNAAYGKPEYIGIYRRQLTELLTHYGPIFEVWHDGANGGDGYYGGAREKRVIDKHSYYDWPRTWELVRRLQPGANIFSDVGPDLRWVGNENGIAGDPCWATYDPVGENGGPAAPGDVREKDSATGTRNGSHWMPAECDVSIRPGWFWHAAENGKVKTPAQLLELYFQSVGRGASLLLNIPPNREGRLQKEDVESLRDFAKLLRSTFEVEIQPQRAGSEFTYTVPSGLPFNLIRLREDTQFGQHIDSIQVELDGKRVASATGIGSCRLIRLDEPITGSQIRLRIASQMPPRLAEFTLFHRQYRRALFPLTEPV